MKQVITTDTNHSRFRWCLCLWGLCTVMFIWQWICHDLFFAGWKYNT